MDLKPAHLKIVKATLQTHLGGVEVRVFGSRVRATAKEWSDLDLAVVAGEKTSAGAIARLNEAFEESDLPFRVDILDWRDISPEFRKLIEEKYEVLQPAAPAA